LLFSKQSFKVYKSVEHSLTCCSRKILEFEFPNIPAAYVRLILLQNKTLTEAYASFDVSERTYTTTAVPAYQQLKKARKAIDDNKLLASLPIKAGPERNHLVHELFAAREERKNRDGNLFTSKFPPQKKYSITNC
jgi:hypothetical protein